MAEQPLCLRGHGAFFAWTNQSRAEQPLDAYSAHMVRRVSMRASDPTLQNGGRNAAKGRIENRPLANHWRWASILLYPVMEGCANEKRLVPCRDSNKQRRHNQRHPRLQSAN